MIKYMVLIYLFTCTFLVNTAYCQNPPVQQTDPQDNNKVIQKEEKVKENTDKSLWQKIKGKKGREVYSHSQRKNTRFDISNKICLIYGYAEDLINVAGMSVFAGAYPGISWKGAGLDSD